MLYYVYLLLCSSHDDWTKAASHLLEDDAVKLRIYEQACEYNFTSEPSRLLSHYRFLSLSRFPHHGGFSYSINKSLPVVLQSTNSLNQQQQRSINNRIAIMHQHHFKISNITHVYSFVANHSCKHMLVLNVIM
jgi:hypothetical protein